MPNLPPNYRAIEDAAEWDASHAEPAAFHEIVAHLTAHNMHGNQGLWDTPAGLLWIWEGWHKWEYQFFGKARKWPR